MDFKIFGEENVGIHLDESGGDSVGIIYWAGLLVLILPTVEIKQNPSTGVSNAKRTVFIVFMGQKRSQAHSKTEYINKYINSRM